MRSINFEEKSRGAKFLYKKKFGAKKVEAKDSETEKLEINILTQNFEIKKIQKKH